MKVSVAVQDLWRHCLDQCSISAGRDLKQQHNGRLWNIIRLQHILKTRLMIVNTNGHCAINQCRQHATNHITLHRWHIKLAYYQPSQTDDVPLYIYIYIHTHTQMVIWLIFFFLFSVNPSECQNGRVEWCPHFQTMNKTKIKQARLHYCLFICNVDKHVFCQSECVLCIALD